MGSTFQWADSQSVKVHTMDAQHKQLFEIVNELDTAMRSCRGKEVGGDVLRRLIDATVNHFGAEEKLLEDGKYPHLEQHRAEHKALTDKLVLLKKDFDAGLSAITPALIRFLQNWLTGHIQDVDQKYGDFLNAQGVH